MPEFIHRFEDQSKEGCLSIDLAPPPHAKIRIGIDEGNVWLSANPEGWLHLARVASELGACGFEPGYHFHRSFTFGDSTEGEPEVSFGVDERK
jgi:hypothetical protein